MRYNPPSLDKQEDFLVGLKRAGVTQRSIQRELRRKHVYVSVSTIKRFFHSLPRARFKRDVAPSKEVREALARIDESRGHIRAANQAEHWIRKGLALGTPRHGHQKDGKIHSLGTARNYQQSLTLFCRWLQERKVGDLKSSTADQAIEWLNACSIPN